jgi:hypothetical protein
MHWLKSSNAGRPWRQKWPTPRQAETANFQHINGVYNTRRHRSFLSCIGPLAFEAKVA